jgi:hypothetical protein
MPDGNFYFSFDAGNAKIKNDGSGNANCAIPMTAEMWGRVDCKDRDHAIIKLETIWWLGKKLENPEGMRRPSPNPSDAPSNMPSVQPTVRPSGTPSTAPAPAPTPVIVPSPGPSRGVQLMIWPASPSRDGGSVGTQCVMPKSCYLHNISHINQCS